METIFALRHVKGFPPEMFELFRAACGLYVARVKAWEKVGGQDVPKWAYEFAGPELSENGTVASFRVAGDRSYGQVKTFEDGFPKEFWEHFPSEFREGLEWRLGKTGAWGLVAELEEAHLRELVTLGQVAAQQLRGRSNRERRGCLSWFWRG